MLALTRRQRAHVLIHNAAAAAGGIGAGWIGALWLVPDWLPLGLLLGGLITGLCRLFLIRPLKAVLFALPAAFLVTLVWRGLDLLFFSLLPAGGVALDVVSAALLTELGGWLAYAGLLALRQREAAASGSHPPEWLAHAVEAAEHGPLRVLASSAPMVAALVAALIVPSVRHTAEVRLRAPDAPAGAPPLHIDYPLIERHEGRLWISGTPAEGPSLAGAGEAPPRLRLEVRNDALVDEMERQVIAPATPRVRVLVWAPAGPPVLVVGPAWQAEVERSSDYWAQVRGRLYLLILGLCGSLAMLWLGAHRSRRPFT